MFVIFFYSVYYEPSNPKSKVALHDYTKERFLSNQKRSQPITLPKEFSDEEMV